ncbi:MAG TPA: hypothetical protein VEA63_08870, partial [Opitutus sp.]|nr:hypothetical protein [Opitutus sp.]
MPDPALGTVDPDFSSAAPTAREAEATAAAESGQLKVGERWRDLMIEAEIVGSDDSYYASHVGLMERVVVREFPVTPANEWRRGAWERLCALSDSKVVRCIEAHEEGGWRFEVSGIPPTMTMREWMSCRRPSFADIEALMRQLTATLGALHAQGVVHLNIRPEAIFIDETKGEPVYLLGGLEEATLYTQPEVRLAEVD